MSDRFSARRGRPWLALSAAVTLALAACSADDDGAVAGPATTAAASTTAASVDDPPELDVDDSDEPDDPDDMDERPVPGPTDAPTVGAGIGLLGFDVPTVGGLDAVMGEGDRPRFAWVPVEGAVEYIVLVRTPDGEPYWAATTAEPSVTVEDGLDPRATGTRMYAGMRWAVIALDASGTPIAQSAVETL